MEKKIIELKTAIPGEFERYVWFNGALMRHEDYLTEMARIFPEHRTDILDLNLWGRLVSLVPSTA
jgi:hypothetical protein